MRRLTLRSQLDCHSGYGVAVCEFFKWMTNRDIFVSLRPTGIDEQYGASIPKEMRAQIVHTRQPEEFELLIYPPTLPGTPERKTVILSMWEATEIPAPNVHLMNRCVAVITPCNWCKESFEKSGVTKPVVVVPLGMDDKIFTPIPLLEGGPTVFGIAGRVAHCAKRKGIQEAIDLFLATFKGFEDVRLHVKIHPDDKIKPINDKRVKIFRDVMEGYQLSHWLHGLTAYMTLSRAEGYGLWPLQSLACGRPVIGCKYSGQADFMTDENSFIIPHKEVSCDGVGDSNVAYEGMWAQPDMKAAAKIMLAIHRNRKLAIEKSLVCATSVAHLTWEKCTDRLIKVLTEIGAL